MATPKPSAPHRPAPAMSPALGAARPAATPSNRRPAVRSAALRRAWHVVLWLGQAVAVSAVVSAIMLAWVLFDGGAR